LLDLSAVYCLNTRKGVVIYGIDSLVNSHHCADDTYLTRCRLLHRIACKQPARHCTRWLLYRDPRRRQTSTYCAPYSEIILRWEAII